MDQQIGYRAHSTTSPPVSSQADRAEVQGALCRAGQVQEEFLPGS